MKKRTFMHLTMRVNIITAGLLAFYCCLVVPYISKGQNPTGHYHNIYNQALDYMSSGNYMLMGRSDPANVSTYDNAATFGNNPRIHLQILDPNLLTTVFDKTYCTQDEIMLILNSHCNNLSVAFYPTDAKQTSDGGFIVCGHVRRDAETNSCGLPEFRSEFLLKVDATGLVQWFKRYEDGLMNALNFRSVIETSTGNYIVVGTYYNSLDTRALMVAVDNTGNVINQHIMRMNLYSDPSRETPTDYREVSTFGTMGGTFYALVGSSYSYMPVEGGVLVTIVNGAGAIMTNTVVTSAGHDIALIARGVTGTTDGEIAITGEALPYNANLIGNGGPYTYNFMPFVLKLDPVFDPMFGTVDFLKSYQYPYSDMLPYSITSGAEGNMYFSGDFRGVGAFKAAIDMSGNWTNGEAEGVQTGYYSNAIVYDWSNGYAVWSGDAKLSTYPSFVTTDEYNGNNYCGINFNLVDRDIPFNYHLSNADLSYVYDIDDDAVAFDVNTVENIACGTASKPGRPSGIDKLNATNELKLVPNPANDHISVSIPASLMRGRINIVDMLGKTVLTKQLNGTADELRIDILSLNNGVYILSVQDDNTKQHIQFIKY